MQKPLQEQAYKFSNGLLDMLECESGDSVIHATLDDVGTCGNDGMCACVGYVAYKPNWDGFNWAWRNALEAIGIDYLHTSNYLYKYSRVGGPPTDSEIYSCLSPFINIILERLLYPPGTGFGMCVVTCCDAYDQLTDDEKKYVGPPEENSFGLAVGLGCMQVQKELTKENTIAVQMDETQSAPELYKVYQALKNENETLKKYLGAICFADDKLHPPVQAADMLGHLTLRAWRAYQEKKEWPDAFRKLVFPNRAANVLPLICGIDFLRGLAQMRKQQNDRSAMPNV